MEFTSFSCRGIWAGMQDKFSDRGFGQGFNKIFQEGDMDGEYWKIFRRGTCTGRNYKQAKYGQNRLKKLFKCRWFGGELFFKEFRNW